MRKNYIYFIALYIVIVTAGVVIYNTLRERISADAFDLSRYQGATIESDDGLAEVNDINKYLEKFK